MLADYAEVEPQYESAVEQFLRDELEYVVVETFDHARAGIAMLREEVGGRATFFVDSLRKLKLTARDEPVVPFAIEPALVSRLDRLVEFRDPLGPAAKQFLPRLQSAFLVEDAEAAERLARENPAYSFLTPDGTCYQGRVVTGGRPAEAGPLVMKRELRSLEAEALRLEREASEAQAALRPARGRRARTPSALSRKSTAQHVEIGKGRRRRDAGTRSGARANWRASGMELADLPDGDRHVSAANAQSAQQRAESARRRREKAARTREAAEHELTEATAREPPRCAKPRRCNRKTWPPGAPKRPRLDERLASAAAIAARIDEERARTAGARCSTRRAADPLWLASKQQLAAAERRNSSARWNRCAPNGSASKRARAEIEQECRPEPRRAPPKWTTHCARPARNSAICARSAADTKSSAPATTPSASTLRALCLERTATPSPRT